MKAVAKASKIVSFSCNFSTSSPLPPGMDNGKIGTYQSPIYLPAGATVYQVTVKVTTAVTAGIGAVISIGWVGNLQALLNDQSVAGDPFTLSSYGIETGDPATTFGGNNVVVPGLLPLLVTIGTAAITGGVVEFIIEYN